jgi:hypothetical protein
VAEITPTPRAGHWITVDGVTVSEAAPRAGTWLRIDAVDFRRPTGGWSVGMILAN